MFKRNLFFTERKNELMTLLKFLSDKTGLIKSVHIGLNPPNEPRIYTASAVAANFFSYVNAQKHISTQLTSAGSGLTENQAVIAALGEVIERYCECIPPSSREIVFGSYEELGRKGLQLLKPETMNPFLATQYSQREFPFRKFTRKIRVSWVNGYSLITRKSVLVPAQFAFIGYECVKEKRITYATSSGCACAESFQEAVVKAINELIERDCTMVRWLAKLPAPKIDIRSDDDFSELFEDRFSSPLLEYYSFLVTLDVEIPAVATAIVDRSGRSPAVAFGSSSDLYPKKALLKSLIEAAQSRSYLRHLVEVNPRLRFRRSYSNITSFKHHGLLYANLHMLPKLEFMFKTKTTVSLDDLSEKMRILTPEDQLRKQIKMLSTLGFDVIAVDLSLPEVRKEGLFVIRVIIPGLVPIHVHRYQFLGSQRIYRLPKLLGYTQTELSKEYLNPLPHPYL